MSRVHAYALVALLAVVLFAAAVCIGCTELACDHHSGANSLQLPGGSSLVRAIGSAAAAVPASALALFVVAVLLAFSASRPTLVGTPAVVPLRV